VKDTIISNEDVAHILKEIDFFLRFHGVVHPMKAKRVSASSSRRVTMASRGDGGGPSTWGD
jgi:hypothetical protein